MAFRNYRTEDYLIQKRGNCCLGTRGSPRPRRAPAFKTRHVRSQFKYVSDLEIISPKMLILCDPSQPRRGILAWTISQLHVEIHTQNYAAIFPISQHMKQDVAGLSDYRQSCKNSLFCAIRSLCCYAFVAAQGRLLRNYGVTCDCLTVHQALPKVPGPQTSEHMARQPRVHNA